MKQTRQIKFDILLEQISTDILSGKFHPRERLVESDLIELYGATRASIRKVLKELEVKHLVKYVPNRGAMVASPNREEMVDIFQARLALENFAIENISIPVAKKTLTEISKYMEAYETAVNKKDFHTQHASNKMFHQTILLLSGNKLITEIVAELKNRSHFWIGRLTRSDMTVLEHRGLFDSLMQGNLLELKRLNIVHLTKGYENFLTE